MEVSGGQSRFGSKEHPAEAKLISYFFVLVERVEESTTGGRRLRRRYHPYMSESQMAAVVVFEIL